MIVTSDLTWCAGVILNSQFYSAWVCKGQITFHRVNFLLIVYWQGNNYTPRFLRCTTLQQSTCILEEISGNTIFFRVHHAHYFEMYQEITKSASRTCVVLGLCLSTADLPNPVIVNANGSAILGATPTIRLRANTDLVLTCNGFGQVTWTNGSSLPNNSRNLTFSPSTVVTSYRIQCTRVNSQIDQTNPKRSKAVGVIIQQALG